jgi:membrane-bound inhibitor of C-type lysozyme
MWHSVVGVGLIALILSVLGLVAYVLYGPGIVVTVPDLFSYENATTTEEVPEVDLLAEYQGTLFECSDRRSLKAEFLASSVRLALSDGRSLTLPQIISASGARYANTDGSFVFQSKDTSAFIEESRVITYTDCIMKP